MSREEWSDVTPVAFPASDSYLYVNQDAISRCISWGPGLADGITQGVARGDEFRTAPLWGIGQRMFFLHHGRRSDLLDAIKDHASVLRRHLFRRTRAPRKRIPLSQDSTRSRNQN